ncbi:bifunctional 4-hydroxy-2-oxoglutarate aldolase/2-dehydro-3-deoxy-phosphogluconate aldolase [bacterium]|nr:bifunctional 4-hydroxy-2-oxoglutarate aldolase/2-dehydro-3-deoxy-phosphogluconate aldolase [bacterium]
MSPISALQKTKLLPLVTFRQTDQVGPLCEAFLSSRVNCIEIAYRSQLATEAISIAATQKGLWVGAGTVVTLNQAVEAVTAGAHFVVSPGLIPEVIEFCIKKDVPHIPGIATPSEIITAMKYGLKFLKFFPAESMGGVKAIKDFCGPFTDVQFMPTGGINQNNFLDYLSIPQVFCCSGSWLARPEDLETKKYDQIEKNCQQTMQMINEKIYENTSD